MYHLLGPVQRVSYGPGLVEEEEEKKKNELAEVTGKGERK